MLVNRRRRYLALLASSAAVVVSCTSPSSAPDARPAPDAAIARFAAAWQGLRTDAIAAGTTDPATAAQEVGAVLKNLAPTRLVVTAGKPTAVDSDTATAPAVFDWTMPGGVTWKYTATWTFTRTGNDPWRAQWASKLINPRLGEAQTVVLRTTEAADGAILDRNKQQILGPTTIYSVVALPGKIPDLPAAAALLTNVLGKLDQTVTVASVVAGVKAAKPDVGYTVTNLREGDYQQVRSQLNTISGLTFPSATRNLPPTKDFAKLTLSEAAPVAKKLTLGTPGWEIDSVDATGAQLETLAAQPARDGTNVILTIDSAIQRTAEQVLGGTREPAVLVAIQPSTGEILAVAQNAAANAQGPLALTGQYPPGSTFKVVTATAGFDDNLITPLTRVDCSGQVIVDSRPIHNYHSFDLGTVSLTEAFAKSCNTTFAKLATRMPDDALTRAASQYGIGRDFVIQGLTTLTGKVPMADSMVQKAENGFGQGVVLVTPFSSALMAATAAGNDMPMPTLIRGTKTTIDQPAPPRSATARTGIKTLMRAVVTEGTGTLLADSGNVSAKTGTADFIDAQGADHAHAWTLGFRGDLAFSILIVGGNSSVRTTAIAAAFLQRVPVG